ncbi:MAG: hypothetical protein LBL34_03410 [Clostridiales bacterium]|jgi:hypothetical protein|nr:hypothetical protein [Clostridiales bacterium]
MIKDRAVEKETPFRIMTIGIEALREKLGAIGVAEFFRYFGLGYGDYTKERKSMREGQTLDEICEEIRAKEQKI